ncbi:MAG: mannose-6-phosphate isomerase [Bacteroidetes bacterium]|nr:mannose-6-phosphate isomerase [Bacteroidota bacterium]
MNSLYPLKFQPLFREKIWGGHKIRTLLGLDFGTLSNCGEAWVLSGVPGNQTLVTNGFLEGNELNELVEIYMGDLVGDEVYEKYGDEFPILLKFVDSNEYLSIQVHPDDYLARKRHSANGKTEMWIILDADPGAELISGFSTKVDKETYLIYLKEKRLREILHSETVKKGDVFFTPAGRVHAIGPGILLAEIQQTSDITYRIYDWDRVDEKGHSRELHTDLALDALDFTVLPEYKTHYTLRENGTTSLIKSEHFITNLIDVQIPLKKDYGELDSFVIYLCTEGSFRLVYDEGDISVKTGESVLIPNILNLVGILPMPSARILEVYIH